MTLQISFQLQFYNLIWQEKITMCWSQFSIGIMTILFSFIQEIKLLTKLDCANNPITQNPPLNSFRKNSQLHHVLSKERKIGTFFLRKLFYLVTLSGFMFLFYVRSMRQFEELSGVEKER